MNSKAIYINGRWKEIKSCGDCIVCSGGEVIAWCRYLQESWKKVSGSGKLALVAYIEDTKFINEKCPLIDYELARWHDMNERPSEGERVNVEVMFDTKQVRTGHTVRDSKTWVIDGFGFVYGGECNIKLLRWRYIL